MAMEWIRNPRTIKVLKIVGIVLFALITFVISIGYTLPEDRVKSLIESRAADAGLNLSIDDLDAGGFGSIKLKGLKIELAPIVSEAADGSRIEQPRKMEFDEVDANIGLFSLMMGRPSVTINIDDEGGHAGPVRIKANKETVDVEVDEIVDFPIPRGMPAGPFPLAGIIRTGKGHLAWNRESGISESEGAFELTVDKLVALKPVLNTKQAGTMALTDISMGKLEASIIIDKRSNIPAFKGAKGRAATGGDGRVIYFEKFNIDGKDIRAMVEGNSIIRMVAGRPLSKAQMTVEMAFAIDDAFYSKTPKDSTETPNKFLKTLLDLDPRWKSARSGEYYGLVCTGSLDRPACVPKKPSVRSGDFKTPRNQEGDSERAVRPKANRKRPTPVKPAAVQEEPATGQDSVEQRLEQPPVPPPAQPPAQAPADEAAPQGGEGSAEPGNVEIKVGGDAVMQPARRAGPRGFMPVNAGDQMVGGRAFIDKAENIRGDEDMRTQLNVKPQEAGEPSEE